MGQRGKFIISLSGFGLCSERTDIYEVLGGQKSNYYLVQCMQQKTPHCGVLIYVSQEFPMSLDEEIGGKTVGEHQFSMASD